MTDVSYEEYRNARLNLSFAGCGFLGIYHVGVCSCLREYAPYLYEGKKIAGASAGAIAACCLMCNCSLGDCTSYVLNVVMKARKRTLGPFHPGFSITNILRDGLDHMLPDNAHLLCSGRLHISITKVHNWENELVSQFNTKAELIEALLCSAFIPLFSGVLLPEFRGERVLDGGFSNNLPELDDHSVTVSPFCGEVDICPRDDHCMPNSLQIYLSNMSFQLTSKNLWRTMRIMLPPGPEVLTQLCKQGFDDCLHFLQRNNLISCWQHNPTVLDISARVVPRVETGLVKVELDSSSSSSDETALPLERSPHFHPSDGGCRACKRRLAVALRDSLPPQVMQALALAGKRSLARRIYETYPVRLLRLMIQPWTLPIDILYLLCKRFLTYLPSLPSDVQWLFKEAAGVVETFLKRFQFDRKRYNARLTCHLNMESGEQTTGAEFDLNLRLHLRAKIPQDLQQPLKDDILQEVATLSTAECQDLASQTGELTTGASGMTWYYLDEQNEVHISSIMPTEPGATTGETSEYMEQKSDGYSSLCEDGSCSEEENEVEGGWTLVPELQEDDAPTDRRSATSLEGLLSRPSCVDLDRLVLETLSQPQE